MFCLILDRLMSAALRERWILLILWFLNQEPDRALFILMYPENYKVDMLRVWVHSTDVCVIVISEYWLSRSIMDQDIGIDGYNVHRSNQCKRGRGVAIFVKDKFLFKVLTSKSPSKQFEFLALDLLKGIIWLLWVIKGHPLLTVGHFLPWCSSYQSCIIMELFS